MNSNCPKKCNLKGIPKKPRVKKSGFFYRKSDSRKIQRFTCLICGKNFSKATFSPCYNQKKRRFNEIIFKLLSSGVSMRRIALILNLNRITVKKKMIFLAKRAKKKHEELLNNLQKKPIYNLQFDDLITSEHTKMKPLSISIAVDATKRIILGAEVSRIPAFGHLAEKSRKKYGLRPNEHSSGLLRLFKKLKNVVQKKAIIKSDEHQLYPRFVRKYFPESSHLRFKGERGSVIGQGELKKVKFDPLFTLNHTCAMLRANINRLIRRTWCTTKKTEMLQNHLYIYMDFHNSILVS